VARARFRALAHGIIFLDHGHEIVVPAVEHAGRTALSFAFDQ